MPPPSGSIQIRLAATWMSHSREMTTDFVPAKETRVMVPGWMFSTLSCLVYLCLETAMYQVVFRIWSEFAKISQFAHFPFLDRVVMIDVPISGTAFTTLKNRGAI